MPDLIASLREALAERYDVVRQLGEGAHAKVYLARDLRHGRHVAIKLMKVNPASETAELRFIREIRLLAGLQHPNILPLHDSGYFGTHLYYVMPFVDGETLRDRLRRERRLPLGDAIAIAHELADALSCAHAAGVVHRDVKPENVLLAGGRPVLADFGVAVAMHVPVDRNITKTGDRSPGTPAYMSPEQLIGGDPVDGRSDVYGLACVLFELLAGTPPFDGSEGFARRFMQRPPSLASVRPDVPAALDRVVQRALERKPDDRFPSAREFALALVSSMNGDLRKPSVRREQSPIRATPSGQRGVSRRVSVLPQLVPPLNTLVGRESEVATLKEMLRESRLLTVLGPGGVGKSHLAQYVASDVAAQYRHGVHIVPLGGIAAPELVWAAIGEFIGLGPTEHRDARSRLLAALRKRNILLVLDGFEHLVRAAPGIQALLEQAPEAHLLITSRERLNLTAEAVLELKGLSTPHDAEAGDVVRHAAVRMFVQRARQVVPGFALGSENEPSVTQICRLVDGLPLAIELAASMLRVLDCQEVAAELDRSLDILATTMRDVPPRHRNLRAVFDQSWSLLDREGQEALMRLSIFAAGFSRDAARVVGGASLDVLGALADKSLLKHMGVDRYELHAVIQQHARARLPAAELRAAVDAHAAYYGEFVHARHAKMNGSGQHAAASEIVVELANIRAGWQHAVNAGREEVIESYLDGLAQMFLLRGWYREGATEFGNAASSTRPTLSTARALARYGKFLMHLAEIDASRAALAKSLKILRQVGARREMPFSIRTLAEIATVAGRHAAAERLLRRAVRICREEGDEHELALALVGLAFTLVPQGKVAETEAALRQSIALLQKLGDESGFSIAATNLGAHLAHVERFDEAIPLLKHAMESARALGNQRIVAAALLNLGNIAQATGDIERGIELTREGLEGFRAVGNDDGAVGALKGLGDAETSRGQTEEAMRDYREALRCATRVGPLRVMHVLTSVARLLFLSGDLQRAGNIAQVVLASDATDIRDRASTNMLVTQIAERSGGVSAPPDYKRSLQEVVQDILAESN